MMKFRNLSFSAALLAAGSLPTGAFAETQNKHVSPYQGQQKRAIKSLSAKDVEDLSHGRGWGFAKAAELNGMPGPSHLLEMADAIELTSDQRAKIQSLFDGMKAEAVPLGKELVAGEIKLEQMFRGGKLGEDQLRAQLTEIGGVRTRLRHVHLATHLKTPAILSRHQIVTYNRLRGYADGGEMDHSKMGDHGK
ncbi:MAG: hypothetical protein HQ503_17405 [Rhodospirillales bacterium]|nr:hypothetical protein [Rhodospirillales bacterium]